MNEQQLREAMQIMGSRGGFARASRYDHAQLSVWAHLPPRGGHPALDYDAQVLAAVLRRQGQTLAAIAERLGTSISTVARACKRQAE